MTTAPHPDIVPDLANWYRKEYANCVGLIGLEGGTAYSRLLGSLPAAGTDNSVALCGGMVRCRRFNVFKSQGPTDTSNYICVALIATMGRESVCYAYVYWLSGADDTKSPAYICFGHTFGSQDGEYRAQFIEFSRFVEICEITAPLLACFEDAVGEMLTEGRLTVEFLTAPANTPEDTVRVVKDRRIALLALALTIGVDLRYSTMGIMPPHTDAKYIALLELFHREYPTLSDDSTKLWKGSQLLQVAIKGDVGYVPRGQKMVPMSVREVLQPANCNYAAWRELAITQLAGDFTTNLISPSFAMYGGTAYLEDAPTDIFSNPAMEGRYQRGAAAEKIIGVVREARRRAITAEGGFRFSELAARLYDDVEYAQGFLLMSKVVMLHTVEHVHRTLLAMPAFIRRSGAPASTELMFTVPSRAVGHIFELAYAAHCLHTKLGVAHTDLHANNMTAYMWNSQPPNSHHTNPVTFFVAGPRGEIDTFAFDTDGISCCIIDFSRAILGPGFRPHLEAGRTPQYATNIYRDQINRVLRAFHRYAPDFVAKHQGFLKSAIIGRFDEVFPVLCAVDFVAIGTTLGAIFAAAAAAEDPMARRQLVVAKEAVTAAKMLETIGREALITGLHGLLSNSKLSSEFPGHAILHKIFADWTFPVRAAREPEWARTAELVDAYNYNNDMKYTGADYARFPPWSRLEKVIPHLSGVPLDIVFPHQGKLMLEVGKPVVRREVVAAQLRAEQERMDGPPIPAASSWIAD